MKRKGDRSEILRHGLTAEEITLYYLHRSKCDLCDMVFPWDGRMHNFHLDHDHGHCPTDQGCPDCVRGFLCTVCNMLDGQIVKAVQRGLLPMPTEGRLAEYWADPPFQRWRRRGPTRWKTVPVPGVTTL